MSDPIQSIARHLGIQTFGDGLLAKIGQTIDLLQEAARNRADLAAECERLREQHQGSESQAEYQRDRAEHFQAERDAALAELAALKGGREAVAWYTDDHLEDRSATTYSKAMADRWVAKGWKITPLYTAPPAQASAWPEATEAMVMAARGVCVSFRGHYGEHNDYLDDCTARQILRAAMLAATPTPGASDGKGGEK